MKKCEFSQLWKGNFKVSVFIFVKLSLSLIIGIISSCPSHICTENIGLIGVIIQPPFSNRIKIYVCIYLVVDFSQSVRLGQLVRLLDLISQLDFINQSNFVRQFSFSLSMFFVFRSDW